MATRFVPLGLCTTANSLQDAFTFANNFIANKRAFSEALTKSFRLWMNELTLREPKKGEWNKFFNDCDAKIHGVFVRMADFGPANKYAITDETVNTIWMNPLVVTAQEEVKLQVLTDLIRVKFLREIWHLLTPCFITFAMTLGYKKALNQTPRRVGLKAGGVGDNGYAFEEVTLGGRLFLRQGTKLFTQANALDLEKWFDTTLVLTHVGPGWNTNNKDIGNLKAFLAPSVLPPAKQDPKKRKRPRENQDSEQELESTAQTLNPRELWPGHPDLDVDPLPPGRKS